MDLSRALPLALHHNEHGTKYGGQSKGGGGGAQVDDTLSKSYITVCHSQK